MQFILKPTVVLQVRAFTSQFLSVKSSSWGFLHTNIKYALTIIFKQFYKWQLHLCCIQFIHLHLLEYVSTRNSLLWNLSIFHYFPSAVAVIIISIPIIIIIIIILVLYEHETWSLTLMEEYRLRLFKKRWQSISDTKEEVTGNCIKLHSMELHNLYSLPNIIRLIKLQVLTGGSSGSKDKGILGFGRKNWW